MKLIVDVGVGRAVEETLREMGHDVLSVRDIDAGMGDREILEHAAVEERLLVTMDKDFGDLAVREGAANAGVLLLRLEEASGGEKAQVVRRIMDDYGERIANHVAVYQGGRLRVRGSS